MNSNIRQEEMLLLAYLHEHADGYGESSPFMFKEVAAALETTESDLKKSASYLKEKGLVGIHVIDASSNAGFQYIFFSIWLTGSGEDYMRAVEEQLNTDDSAPEDKKPGTFRKITFGLVKESWSMIKGVSISVLSDYLKGHH